MQRFKFQYVLHKISQILAFKNKFKILEEKKIILHIYTYK